MRTAFAVAALALVAAPAASAAAPIDGPTKARVKSVLENLSAGDLAYVPTSLPPRYKLLTFSVDAQQASYTFYDAKYGQAKSSTHAVYYAASVFRGKRASCAKGSKGTIRSGGLRMYTAAAVVWRCLTRPSGRIVELSAFGNDVKLPALAAVVASSRRIT